MTTKPEVMAQRKAAVREVERSIFLSRLREETTLKGPYVKDGAPPKDSQGCCVIGLAAAMYGQYYSIPQLMQYKLGISRKDIFKIQNEWNDSSLTFPQIADLIENRIFGGCVTTPHPTGAKRQEKE